MDKLQTLKLLTGATDSEDSLLLALLSLAEGKILERLYPYDHSKETIPTRYVGKQIEIAAYLYNKQGAEGQIAHSENGISRTYESADVPESMLRGIAPFVGGIK
jgi:Phage QLRG family, putative DNA packaging.